LCLHQTLHCTGSSRPLSLRTTLSFNVRKSQPKRIQPYDWSHPMGGGLGATGAWGVRFAPNSFLARFFRQTVVMCVGRGAWLDWPLYFFASRFVILKTGITNYYLIKDPELKTYCLAMVLIAFAYNIGNYPAGGIGAIFLPTFIFTLLPRFDITLRLINKVKINVGRKLHQCLLRIVANIISNAISTIARQYVLSSGSFIR